MKNRIEEIRKAGGIRQEDFAKALGGIPPDHQLAGDGEIQSLHPVGV